MVNLDKRLEAELKSPKMRNAIRAYAKRVHRVLAEMGSLSDTGVPLSREFHTTVHLHACEPEMERLTHWRSSGSTGGKQEMRPPIAETTLLHSWLAGPAQPILLLAPFGSGKSVVLETFAVELAERLLDNESYPNGALPPFVPLPVRLRNWRWYRDEAPAEKFRGFLHRSQLLLAEEDEDGLLSSEQITMLLKAKLLVPLFDGFDELPSAYTSGKSMDPRGKAWKDISSLCRGNRFAVASRPGHGAEGRFRPEQMHTIQEMSSVEVESYLSKRFPSANMHRQAVEAYRKVRPLIDQVLRRPLFLIAWCGMVAEAPSSPPETMSAIMESLILKAFHPRRISEAGLTGENIRHDRPLFGDLIAQFAKETEGENDEPFTTVLTREDLTFRLKNHPQLTDDGTLTRIIRWLVKAGLLQPVGETRFWVNKIPLVEYLIGRRLADRAEREHDGRQELIVTFRKWIWQPHLHDILDYTFDALWHGSLDQSDLALDLLDWLVVVGQHDITRLKPLDGPSQDDLVRPFALTALRWHVLNQVKNEKAALAAANAAREVGPSFASALRYEVRADEILKGPSLCGVVLLSLLDGFFANYDWAIGADAVHAWRDAISAAADRVSEAEAAGFVREWIQLFDGRDSAAGQAWRCASRAAAGRINEADAVRIVQEWIQHLNRGTYVNVRLAWHDAILMVTERINEDDAPGIVQEWFRLHEQAKDSAVKEAWRLAIYGAASRVREADAAALVQEWIKQHFRAKEADDKEAWKGAIFAAVNRLSEADAAGIVYGFIRLHEEAKETWSLEITTAAGRVSEAAAAALVKEWIKQFDRAKEPNAKEAWQDAVRGAASRISEADAAGIVNKFTQRLDQSRDDAKSIWRVLIQRVAGRVGEWDAVKIVHKFIQLLDRSRDDAAKRAWRDAIEKAAGRVSEANAARIVQQWIKKHERTKDDCTKQAWRVAIGRAAARVSEADAAGIIHEFIQLLDISNDDVAKQAWRNAIGGAASRVRRAGDCLCNVLIDAGIVHVAFQIAARSTDVTIVSQSAENRKVVPLRSRPPIMAKRRCALVLDKDLVAIPDSIQKLLSGPIRLSFKAEQLLRALAKSKKEAERDQDETAAWLSMSALFRAADVTRQRVDTKALLGELLKHGFAKTTGKKYGITPAGEQHLGRK